MGKRKRISAAVHAEFSEYSSLLRALRTADTLDLSSHILSDSYHASGSNVTLDDEDRISVHSLISEDDRSLHDATLSEHRASSPPASSSVPPTQPTSPARSVDATERSPKVHRVSSQPKKPRKPRDTWTRWPLLANDVHIPEFSFEEEMRLLAVQALEHRAPDFVERMHITERSDSSKRSRSNRTKLVDFASSSDEEERKIAVSRTTSRRPPSRRPSRPQTPAAVYAPPGELLSPAYLRALHQCSANRLSEILACLTAILPMRESSMQNRSGTINWEIVLGTVRSLGLIDQETFERLRDRMLALYANKPNYCANARDRLSRNVITTQPAKFVPNKERVQPDLSFLDVDWLPPGPNAPQKKTRGKYKKRKTKGQDQAVQQDQNPPPPEGQVPAESAERG